MELEESTLRAAPVRAPEGAASFIPSPYLAFDRGRDMPRTRRGRPSGTRTGDRCVPSFLQVLDEHRQRPLEDRGRIAGRNSVAQQVLRSAELVVRLTRHGELHSVTLGRQWGDDGQTFRRGRVRRRCHHRDTWRCGRLSMGASDRRADDYFRPLLWSGRGQLANRRCDGGLRTRLRNELFHVALALVPRSIEQREMVVIRQHWREEADRR